MPKINATHAQYDAHRDQWQRCREAAAGSDVVKQAGTRYLPRLSGQDGPEYEAYKLRADWYGATDRTIAGLAGAIFRRAMRVEFSEGPLADKLLANLSLSGLSADQMAYALTAEEVTVSRYILWVDYPGEYADDSRPYVVAAQAEAVINWDTVTVGGRVKVAWVVLAEEAVRWKDGDRFQREGKPQWRLLELVWGGGEDVQPDIPPAPGPRYEVSLWERNSADAVSQGGNEFIEIERKIPLRRGKPLDFIPLVFFGPTDTTPDVSKPVLIDLVDMNFSHYRSSADLEYGRHFCGLPTPWVAGFPRETTLRIGSNIAWVSDRPEARAGMLEFTGQGLGALEKALESKERLMAVLGARLLEEQKRAAEAAATVELRQSGETSTLIRIIQVVEEGFTQILRWVAWWADLTNDPEDPAITVTLNRDLAAIRATPQEIAALVQALQGGAMSFETVYANLERLEMTREGVTAEDELEAIQAREEQTLVERPGTAPTPADQVRIQQTVEAVARQAGATI